MLRSEELPKSVCVCTRERYKYYQKLWFILSIFDFLFHVRHKTYRGQ